jgi:hypothetical protein
MAGLFSLTPRRQGAKKIKIQGARQAMPLEFCVFASLREKFFS